MILDCGETWETKLARLQEWHPFFTLLPRRIAVVNGRHQCAWLQTIYRKGAYIEPVGMALLYGCGPYWRWEYRLSGDQDRQ